MKEHLKMIFCWRHFFSPFHLGNQNIQKFQVLEKKIENVFGVLEWQERDFALKQSTQNWFFVDVIFLLMQYGGRKIQKIKIFEKKIQRFWSPKMVWNGIGA